MTKLDATDWDITTERLAMFLILFPLPADKDAFYSIARRAVEMQLFASSRLRGAAKMNAGEVTVAEMICKVTLGVFASINDERHYPHADFVVAGVAGDHPFRDVSGSMRAQTSEDDRAKGYTRILDVLEREIPETMFEGLPFVFQIRLADVQHGFLEVGIRRGHGNSFRDGTPAFSIPHENSHPWLMNEPQS